MELLIILCFLFGTYLAITNMGKKNRSKRVRPQNTEKRKEIDMYIHMCGIYCKNKKLSAVIDDYCKIRNVSSRQYKIAYSNQELQTVVL